MPQQLAAAAAMAEALDSAMAELPVALAVVDNELRLLRANDHFLELASCDRATAVHGTAIQQAVPTIGSDLVPVLQRVLGSGATETCEVEVHAATQLLAGPTLRASAPGSALARTLELRCFPIPGEAGERSRVAVLATDVTRCMNCEHRLALARAHAQALSQAGTSLAASLDLDETLESLVQMLVPGFADACTINVHEPGEPPDPSHLRIAGGVSERQMRDVRAFIEASPDLPQQPWSGAHAERTGMPVLVSKFPEELAQELGSRLAAAGDGSLPMPSSMIIVPLMVRGQGVGHLNLYSLGGRSFEPEDVELVQEVARLAAASIDNVQQRTRLSASVHAAQSLADAVLGSVGSAAITLATDGTVTTWNAGAIALFGYDVDEAIGLHLSTLFPPEEQQACAWMLAHARSEGSGLQRDLPQIRKGGATFDAACGIAPLLDLDGELVGLVYTAQDVSAEQRARQQTMHHARELTAMNDRLRSANERLQQVDTARSAFTSMLSHELRSPLAVISGFAQTLTDLWDALPEPDRHTMVGEIRESAERVNRLVSDLLTVSRIDEGVLQPEPYSIAIGDVLAPALEEAGIAEPVVHCEPGVRAYVDPDHLQQLLVNLLTNARRHGAPPIELHVSRAGETVRIEVIDHGPGVPAELRSHVFERFARAAMQLPRRSGSTGLGLWITRSLALAQGGDVTYEPAEHGGARFVVTLPVRGADQAGPPGEPAAAPDDQYSL